LKSEILIAVLYREVTPYLNISYMSNLYLHDTLSCLWNILLRQINNFTKFQHEFEAKYQKLIITHVAVHSYNN